MVYVITTADLSPQDGWELSTVTPGGGREACMGCAAGTLLDAPDSALVDAGLAEPGPPRRAPITSRGRDALVEGKSAAFIAACQLLGHI